MSDLTHMAEPFKIKVVEPIKVKKDQTIKIASLTIKLIKNPTQNNSWLHLVSWSRPTLFADEENITGRIVRPDRKYLEESKPPDFIGLSEVTSANSFGDKNPGNILLLDWRTPAGAFDRTKHQTIKGERLHFRVFKSLDARDWEMISEDEAPYAGNLENIAFVYEDKELDDGTQYYYKVNAVDALGNEKEGAILGGMPKDLTPPKDISSLQGFVEDGRIILEWQNPKDFDLGGIIILRNEDKPVDTKSLEVGKEYFIGDLPLGRDKGEVVFASFQEDFDPEMVPTDFVDDYVEPEIKYYYKIFTYDRDTLGPPTEMGRNYSPGIPIVMTTSGQIDTHTFSGPSIGIVNDHGVRITDTPVVFPNPFRPTGSNSLTFQYSLNKKATIDLKISDLSLRMVKNISVFEGEEGGKFGRNKIEWNGRDESGALVSNGPYIVSIFAREENRVIGRLRLTVYH